jgi:hypothetical protein
VDALAELNKEELLKAFWDDFRKRGEKDARLLYDNKVILPESIKEKILQNNVNEEILRKMYEEFIRNKFKYLTLLAQDEENADQKMNEILGEQITDWLTILNYLRKDRRKEESAYLYRISQLPSDKVHNYWYNETEEFKEWSKYWKQSIERILGKKTLSNLFQSLCSKLSECCRKVINEKTMAFLVKNWLIEQIAELISLPEHENSSLEDLQKFLEERLQEEIGKDHRPILHGVVNEIKNELTITFASMLMSGHKNEGDYVQEFLFLLKEKFKFEIADFLVQSQTEKGSVLSLARTTVDSLSIIKEFPKASQKKLNGMLKRMETYLTGEGITGSTLLLPCDEVYFFTGSNNLDYDPRKSEMHLSGYEILYKSSLKAGKGKINNFLAFPIERERGISGVLRVVNKLNESGQLDKKGWSLYDKLQIYMLVKWFSTIWWQRMLSKIISITYWEDLVKELRQMIDDLVGELDGKYQLEQI